MQMSQSTPRPRTRRSVKVVLIVSLALNLAVAGLVLGAVMSHGGWPDLAHGRADLLLRALAPQDRRAIGTAVKEAQGGGRRAFRAAQTEALQEVVAALRATPFEAEALTEALAAKSAHMSATRAAADAALAKRLVAMEAPARLALADRLQEALMRRSLPRKPERAAD